MRIVCLLPSATELACALGLESSLVGVTHECDYPPSVAALPKVTRTFIPPEASSADITKLVGERARGQRPLYALDADLLRELAPDLIVTQTLCEVCAVAESDVQAVARSLPRPAQIINLQPRVLMEMLGALRVLGRATDTAARAEEVVASLTARIAAVDDRSEHVAERPRVAFLEWLAPPFSSGHWTPQMIRIAGGSDGFGISGQPSRPLKWEEILSWKPQVVFVAACGYDVERTLVDLPAVWAVPGWTEIPAVRDGRVYVTDGSQYFSRPGPRLVDSLEILAHALHPDVHPLPAGLVAARRVDDELVAALGAR